MTALASGHQDQRFSACFRRAVPGTLFDCPVCGRAGPPGSVTFRQALASPRPGLQLSRFERDHYTVTASTPRVR